MDLGIKGKTAVVTGAASNIGRMIALTLAAEGANIVIADLDEEGAQGVAKECEAKGVKALAVKTNVTDQENVKATMKKAADTFGGIDILVNDAAIFITKTFLDSTPEEWAKQINVNYYGTIYCCYEAIPYMRERGGGRIISVGSDAGRVGENRQAVYSGTKGAIISFSKALCQEIGRYGITVNVVCPGATLPEEGPGRRGFWKAANVPTKRNPEREAAMIKLYPMGKKADGDTPSRLGLPDDVANAITYLASEQAYFVTGQVLSASGGYTRAG
jgi:2-hydroxycyclohexanecarboxyl-CoA dehydrogenase